MSRFGRYLADEVWREERLGRVLRGRMPEPQRPVLIRELNPPSHLPAADRDRLTELFDAEKKALNALNDTRVPKPWDFGDTDAGTVFLVYERPDSAGFQPLPARLTAECWVAVAAEACRALTALQEAGVRPAVFDPALLFVAPTGAVRLLPLGFLHLSLQLGLPYEMDLPSPNLLAPEVRRGEPVQPQSLVFSVASWLYAALAGGAEHSPADSIAAGGVPVSVWERNSSVRTGVADALAIALQPAPGRRYASLRQFAEALGTTGPVPLDLPKSAADELKSTEGDERLFTESWPATAFALGLGSVALAVAARVFGWLR